MCGSAGDRRWQALRLIGIALYAAFLVTAPFEHHDLLCDLKSPQHCTACTSSQLGADPQTPVIFGAWNLADAGCAIALLVVSHDVLLSVQSTGRSPPAHS